MVKDAIILAYREILVKFQWAGVMALVTQLSPRPTKLDRGDVGFTMSVCVSVCQLSTGQSFLVILTILHPKVTHGTRKNPIVL